MMARQMEEMWLAVSGPALRAARLANLKTVPCVETTVDDQTSALLALIENLQRGIPAVSLPSLCAVNTAYINDAEPSMVYGQLVYALGKPEDVVLGLSTSGNSKNVVYAMQVANAMGLKTIALTGAKESKLSALCTCTVNVPETETYKVQELHLPVYHHLCLELEETLFGE